MTATAVEIINLNKTFGKNKALDALDLKVASGEMVALIGASGSGKSTLLRHLSGLITADEASGAIHVLGQTVQHQGRVASGIRRVRSRVGFIFQQFNLVDRLSLLTNVLVGRLARMPFWRSIPRWFNHREKKMAMASLQRVGMAEFAAQRASTLSGGQQQRAAIARALVQGAEIILADEPIASLDPAAARGVMEILTQINQEDAVTVLVTLHQVDYALKYCRRAVALKDGKIVYNGPCHDLSPAMLKEIYGDKFDEACISDIRPESVPMRAGVLVGAT